MFKKYTTIGLLVLLFMVSFTASAQNCVPTPSSPCPPPSAPIDGGVVVMLVLGAAYAVKKLRDNR